MSNQNTQLGIIVRLETENGRRDEVISALEDLFDKSTQHANFCEARVFKGLEPNLIMLVERWNDTPESFDQRASTADYFAAFEQRVAPMIRERQVTFMDGDAVWSRMP